MLNLDTIYAKTIATYYCSIKKSDIYLYRYFVVSAFGYSDTIKTELNPSDTLTFIIENIDACPICKTMTSYTIPWFLNLQQIPIRKML